MKKTANFILYADNLITKGCGFTAKQSAATIHGWKAYWFSWALEYHLKLSLNEQMKNQATKGKQDKTREQ